MVLIYLGLKIWSHKTFKPPPPFQAGYGNQESNVLKKTLIKDMKIRGGQNLTAIIILSPYIIWCENQKGEQYFATIISQRGYGNQRWGGSKYFTETSSSLVGFWKQMGVQNISVIIFWNPSPIGYENQSTGSILLKPHYTCILRKYQTNKLLVSQYPDKSLHLNIEISHHNNTKKTTRVNKHNFFFI